MYTFYCNCSSVQFSQILSKSGLDQKSYSANKKGVKFFETQCSTSIKHPVPDRVKPSFVILTSRHSDAQS